jgi:hypothetical protein
MTEPPTTASAPLSRARSRFGVSLPLILGLLVYSRVILSGGAVIHDGDPYWHIATGRWIIAHGAVPTHDVFSYSMPEAAWISPEWLTEIFMALLYDNFGWAGLVGATAFSVAASVAILLRVLLRTLPPVPALIAAVLAWGTTLTFLVARPHIFALPILVVWVAALVAARSEDRAPPLHLALLMVLWANIHSSYMFGLLLAAALAGEALFLASNSRSRLHTARGWALFGAVSVAAALITPFGIDGLLLPFKLFHMSFSFAVLAEWQSPNFQHFEPLELWLMVLLFSAFSLGWRLPPIRVGILLVLLHMALEHARHAELLGFVAPLVLAPALGPQLKARLGDRRVFPIDRSMSELAKPATAFGTVLAGAILLAVSVAKLHGVAIKPGVSTPAAALAAVTADHVEGPVLNDYEFGGYLIFRGVKPFIDGRYLYGDVFIRRFVEATQVSSDQLPQLLSEYGITWTLFSARRPAAVVLDRLPGWRRLYADDIAVVHVRDDETAH